VAVAEPIVGLHLGCESIVAGWAPEITMVKMRHQGTSNRELLRRLDSQRSKRLLGINSAHSGDTVLECGPPSRGCGFYWLYTNYSLKAIRGATKAEFKGAVDIGELAKSRVGLRHVSTLKEGVFRVVYNGIGGVGARATGGLRARILGEFSGGAGTGSLAIKHSSLNDMRKWRYSWVSFEDIVLEPYSKKRAEEIEVAWRLNYGWPLLCKR